MKELEELGVQVFRVRSSRGVKPHFSMIIETDDVKLIGVDTSRTLLKSVDYDAYLITHAHSDHHGKSAMLSPKAVCTKETAKILEISHGKEYKGENNGSDTFDTHHVIGSCAYMFETAEGVRVLITGDVKDARDLPKCDVLITEGTYGDPNDISCMFEDDVQGFSEGVEDGVVFGAYPIGKAQRAVRFLRESGYVGVIHLEEKTLKITMSLMEDAGWLEPMDGGRTGISVVSPWNLQHFPGSKRFVLTGRTDYAFPAIAISDHVDFSGLKEMVRMLDPEYTMVYHPNGGYMGKTFADYLKNTGYPACSLAELPEVKDVDLAELKHKF